MITPSSLAIILQGAPFPGATFTVTPGGAALDLTTDGATITFCEGAWFAAGRRTTPAHLSFAATPTVEQVHAEICRVLAIVNAPADDPLYDRATAEQALAKVTAERDQARQAYLDLSTNNPLRPTVNAIAERLNVCPAEPGPMLAEIDRLKGLADAHAVVSQRLVGSQKEVAEVSAERDDATARADKLEDRLRRDDELREQIAVAVGLDGSASLALILDTVIRDRPARELSRLSGLLDVLAAPVAFGERRLSTAERAEWALRRALRERDECAPRMAQLIDAEVCLDVLGVPAYATIPSDDPGEASEALTVAERIRLHFGAQS